MAEFVERFIVQDLETFEFICSDGQGGFDQTGYLILAAKFEDYQDTVEVASSECSGIFRIFRFYEKVSDSK